MTRCYTVRESPERDRGEPDQLFWQGAAEDPIEAAYLAVTRGPFPLDYGEMRVWDDRANLAVVTREEREWRMEHERRRLEQPPMAVSEAGPNAEA